jgi:hypothetical protein
MAASSYESVLQMAEALSRDEQLRLIQELMWPHRAPERTSVLELYGLGAEIWHEMDAQEYVNRERSSWHG